MITDGLETLEITALRLIVLGSDIPMGGLKPPWAHLTPFTGNQWNEDWSWNRQALEQLPRSELIKLLEIL